MTDHWKNGTPKELLRDLQPGGWVVGCSGLLPRSLRLHKTDLCRDLRKLDPDFTRLVWRIAGNPEATGRYAPRRRTIVLWLGK